MTVIHKSIELKKVLMVPQTLDDDAGCEDSEYVYADQ